MFSKSTSIATESGKRPGVRLGVGASGRSKLGLRSRFAKTQRLPNLRTSYDSDSLGGLGVAGRFPELGIAMAERSQGMTDPLDVPTEENGEWHL
jgi:hypothetical protein